MTREELQRLVDMIVGELTAASARPQSRCACHLVLDDCCPDRLRGVLDAGATLVGPDEARAIVTTWLTTPMREPRYIRRLAKIRDLEDRG